MNADQQNTEQVGRNGSVPTPPHAPEVLASRIRGTVTYWNRAFRWGFISQPDGFDREVLVRFNGVAYTPGLTLGHDLKVGLVVEYDLVPGNKPGRLQAANVKVLSD